MPYHVSIIIIIHLLRSKYFTLIESVLFPKRAYRKHTATQKHGARAFHKAFLLPDRLFVDFLLEDS